MDVPLIVFLVLLGIGIGAFIVSLKMPGSDPLIEPATTGDVVAFIAGIVTVVSAVLVILRLFWIRFFP